MHGGIRIGPARHRASRALWARNPERVRKESRKSTPGRDPQSPERVRPGVSKESEKSPKPEIRTLSDSFETPGRTLSGLWGSRPGGLFRDSFRTLSGFRARRAREALCRAGPILMEEVPRRTWRAPLVSPLSMLIFIGLEQRGF